VAEPRACCHTAAVLRLREDALAWKAVDEEVLLLDVSSSTYLAGNESATVLWRLLAEGTTEDALVDALVSTYELDSGTARADVVAFVDDCRARGFLVDDDSDAVAS
jgi:hypothetical protein